MYGLSVIIMNVLHTFFPTQSWNIANIRTYALLFQFLNSKFKYKSFLGITTNTIMNCV